MLFTHSIALSISEHGKVTEASLLSISRNFPSAISISFSLADIAEEHLSRAAATATTKTFRKRHQVAKHPPAVTHEQQIS